MFTRYNHLYLGRGPITFTQTLAATSAFSPALSTAYIATRGLAATSTFLAGVSQAELGPLPPSTGGSGWFRMRRRRMRHGNTGGNP